MGTDDERRKANYDKAPGEGQVDGGAPKKHWRMTETRKAARLDE